MKFYTTRDVARLLGWSEAQVRSHARVGYVAPARGPRNGYRFAYADHSGVAADLFRSASRPDCQPFHPHPLFAKKLNAIAAREQP